MYKMLNPILQYFFEVKKEMNIQSYVNGVGCKAVCSEQKLVNFTDKTQYRVCMYRYIYIQ